MHDAEPFRPPLNTEGLRVAHEMVEQRKRERALGLDIPASAKIIAEYDARFGSDTASALGRAIAECTAANTRAAVAAIAFSIDLAERIRREQSRFLMSLVSLPAPTKKRGS